MILREVKTNRYYYFENGSLVTALGNTYMKNAVLEGLLKNGYKISKKKILVPKVYGRIYGICYKV